MFCEKESLRDDTLRGVNHMDKETLELLKLINIDDNEMRHIIQQHEKMRKQSLRDKAHRYVECEHHGASVYGHWMSIRMHNL